MKTQLCCCARIGSPFLVITGVVLGAFATATPGRDARAADSLPTVVRVEEDWELIVLTPDPTTIAPQVTCAIFPVGTNEGLCATFELNHQTQPGFSPGGMQLQLWNGETPLVSRKFPHNGIMAEAGERVTWTQTMTLSGGQLQFEVIRGSSVTWGDFGGQGYLQASVATNLTSLNGYEPQLSVLNSGVGYASNRVQSLKLKAVRVVTSEGDVLQDPTPRTVYSQN